MNFHVIAFLNKLPVYDFTTADILNVVYTCKSVTRRTDDIRGARYVIFGYVIDGTEFEVVCRFINNKVFFITIYEDE